MDSMVSFTVETNEGAFTYQWQYTEPGSEEWANCYLTGYNTNTLTVKAASHRMGMQLRCVVTNAVGESVTSEAAKISQATAPDDAVPEILTQPVSQSVEMDSIVSFTVETNKGNYTYQWQYAEPGSEYRFVMDYPDIYNYRYEGDYCPDAEPTIRRYSFSEVLDEFIDLHPDKCRWKETVETKTIEED
jgi:hypothetical protein